VRHLLVFSFLISLVGVCFLGYSHVYLRSMFGFEFIRAAMLGDRICFSSFRCGSLFFPFVVTLFLAWSCSSVPVAV